MADHTYRYAYTGPYAPALDVGGPVTVMGANPSVRTDVVADSAMKADLDFFMTTRGFTYLSTDPSVALANTLYKGMASGSTSSPFTTSNSFVALPEMTLTGTTSGGNLIIDFQGTFSVTATLILGDSVEIAVFLDGSQVTAIPVQGASIALGLTVSTTMPLGISGYLTGVSAGSHTVDIRYRRPGGTGAARSVSTQRCLRVVEVL